MNVFENPENLVAVKNAAEIKNEGLKKFGVDFDDPKAVLHYSFTLTSQPDMLYELSNMFRDYEAASGKETSPEDTKKPEIEEKYLSAA